MSNVDKYYLKFLKSLAKSKAKSVKIYNAKFAKVIDKETYPLYNRASKVILKSLLITQQVDKRFQSALVKSGIKLTELAKYLTLNTYILPYVKSRKSTVKTDILNSLSELEKSIQSINRKPNVQYEAILLSESIFTKSFDLLKRAAFSLLKATAFTASSSIELIHDILVTTTYPLRVLANSLPGGELLQVGVSQALQFFLIGQSPIFWGIVKVLTMLMNPRIKQSAELVRSLTDGSFGKKVDEMFNRLEKELQLTDINFSDQEPEEV